MLYKPYPKTLSDDLKGYEVTHGLADPYVDTEYGTLMSVDDEFAYVRFTKNGAAKKCLRENVEVCKVQHDHDIMFLTDAFFAGIDLTLSEEEIQQQVRANYNTVLKSTTGKRNKRDPIAAGKRTSKKKSVSKKNEAKPVETPTVARRRASKKKATTTVAPNQPASLMIKCKDGI